MSNLPSNYPTPPTVAYQSKPGPEKSDGVKDYKIVTDTVAGPNVRLKDNLITLFSCIGGTVLGAIIGLIYCLIVGKSDAITLGLIAGAFIGLLAGLFDSGIFLMIYRALRHTKGKHD